VRAGARFALIALTPAAVLLALHAEGVVRSVYGAEYAGSGPFLALTAALFALAGLLDAWVHALMAGGRAGPMALLVAAGLPLAVLLDTWWIPRFGGRGAACASLVAVFLVTAGAIVLARARFGTVLPFATLLRVGLATAGIGALGWQIPSEGFGLVLELGGLCAGYAGLLVLLGEIRLEEIRGMLSW
jgi:O-antigen/teichoic acid export membrane protein